MNLLMDSDHLSCSAICACYLILRVCFVKFYVMRILLLQRFVWIKVLSVAAELYIGKTSFIRLDSNSEPCESCF